MLHKESIPLFISYLNIDQSVSQLNKKELSSFNLGLPYELNQILVATLIKYISQLKTNHINILCQGIVNKFSENKKRVKRKFLLSLLNIYSHKSLETPFTKWKHFKLKKDYDILIDKLNTMQANTKPILKTNNSHHNNNILTQQLNTYRPKNTNEINNFLQKPQHHHHQHSNHNLKDNFLNRQEQHTQRLKQNKTKQENLKEEEMHLIYTFNPKVNNASTNTNNNQGMYQINQYTTSPINNNNIISRNNNFSSNKLISITKSPNLSPKNYTKSSFDRLYRNNCSREQLPIKNGFLYNKNIKNNKSSSDLKTRPKTAFSRHEQLYKHYKTLENKKRKLQKEIDTERGLTFKPFCYTSHSGYTIQSNFDERNKKLLEDRENFVFVFNYLRDRKHNDNLYGNGNKMIKDYVIKKGSDIEHLIQNQRVANQMMLAGKMRNGEEWNYYDDYEDKFGFVNQFDQEGGGFRNYDGEINNEGALSDVLRSQKD